MSGCGDQAVAATHPCAATTAAAVLQRGGNAYDAAVAAAFVLHVVEPHHNGPGGEVSALVYSTRPSEVLALCGQGPLPSGATSSAFADLGLEAVPASGLPSAVVPGAVHAWLVLLRDLGSWRLEEALEYAIGYAERGVPMLPRTADVLRGLGPFFEAEWPTSARAYLDPNTRIGPGRPRRGQLSWVRDGGCRCVSVPGLSVEIAAVSTSKY